MLSIDEAIERLKCMRLFMQIEDSENDSKFLEDDYIANDMAIEALEELKEYKLKEFQCHLAREEGISIGYNKAVDDYVERLKETYKPCKEADNYIYTVVCRRFDDIAQQLKAGGIDGNDRTDT